MFYGAGIPACYLVSIRSSRSRVRTGSFSSTPRTASRVDTKNAMRGGDIDRIVQAFEKDTDESDFSVWVNRETLRGEALQPHRPSIRARRGRGR